MLKRDHWGAGHLVISESSIESSNFRSTASTLERAHHQPPQPPLPTHRVRHRRVGVENQRDNETVQAQHLGENEDQDLRALATSFPTLNQRQRGTVDGRADVDVDVACQRPMFQSSPPVVVPFRSATHHADKQPGLLRAATHTGVTDNPDRKARGETGEADRETRTELDKASVEGHWRGDWL